MAQQLSFDWPPQISMGSDAFFVSDANAEAYAALLQAEGLSAEPCAMARYRISPGGDLGVLRHVLRAARGLDADLLLCHGSKAGFIGRAAGRIRNAGRMVVLLPIQRAYALLPESVE